MIPVFDAHADALQRSLDLGHDLGTDTHGHLDLVKGAKGGLRAIVLTAWVDGPYADEVGASKRRANALLDAADDLFAAHPDKVRLATDMGDLSGDGPMRCVLGIEGGHAIEDDLDQLAHYAGRGVRVMTLTWNNHLSWARSCRDGAGGHVPAGLNDLGCSVVKTMGELGMVVDLSHAGERTFYDALEASEAPPMVSHSGCMALSNHPRNVTDDQLRALAERDGVIGIPFATAFLDEGERAQEQAFRKNPEYKKLYALSNPTEGLLIAGDTIQAGMAAFPIQRVADHVMHALEVAGPRHVAIGSDFDGIDRRPAGLEDASGYPALWEALEGRGVDRATVEAVAFGNAARVFQAAGAVASPG